MTTPSELEKAEISNKAVKIRVEAFYKGTVACSEFAQKRIIPLLHALIKPSDAEKAIIGTYYRMYMWIRSMTNMKSRIHFQAAAAAARSLFELLLDMKILADDDTGQSVKKFREFPEIERFRVAENLVSFADKHPGHMKFDVSQRRRFRDKKGRRKAIEQTIVSLWGVTTTGKLRRPKHWTGKDVLTRAHGCGLKYEELYLRLYPLLSWHIHSGSIGYAGLGENEIEAGFGVYHSVAQDMFLEATVICAHETKLSQVLDWLKDKIADLRVTPLKGLTQKQIQILEKARLSKNR